MTNYIEIEAAQLAELRSSQPIVLLDVRNDDEVLAGVIDGAIHIPLNTLPTEYTKLNPEAKIVCYCHSGIRSAKAASFLANLGYENLYNLRGGILAWGREGYTFVAKA
jgi:rhodanese-related sulfurtransferase